MFPDDTLEDLLAGMPERQGNYLFDLYPYFGSFSMLQSDKGAAQWKAFMEKTIVSSDLEYLSGI